MELEHDECPIHDHKNEKCRHVFVINNAKVNGNGRIVFYVSSENIDPGNKNNVIKKIKKIPTGEFHNARFDIDAVVSQALFISLGSNGTNTPAGVITPNYYSENSYELQFSQFDNAVFTVKNGPIYFIGTIKPNNIIRYTFPMIFSSLQAANTMLNTIYTTLNNTIPSSISVTALTYTQGSGGLTIIGTYLPP
jgi:hypothetical protein